MKKEEQLLERKVSAFIRQNQLMDVDKSYLVALSGGADSVCLFLALQRLGFQIEAIHCNFHLRGEESNRDEAFVKELCEQHHVKVHLVHFDTFEYANFHKVSIEMAARDLRYRYFEQLRRDMGADGICIAHHQDDSVETILINFIRGTGLKGLTGIQPRNGFLLRPLLCVNRMEIENYLKTDGQTYVTDSTNLDADAAIRNKIRLAVLPLLKTINPSTTESILQTAKHLAEAKKVVNWAIDKTLEGGEYSLLKIKNFPSSELLLFKLLQPYGFSSAQIEQLSRNLDTNSGRIYQSSTHQLLIDRERIIIEPIQEVPPTLVIPESGIYIYNKVEKFDFRITEGKELYTEKSYACLDADKVSFPLTIRPVKIGDRFVPFGMQGSRLVSDFLTDRKKTLFEKRRQLVVTNAQDDIIWLVGQRPDNRFCLDEDTKQTILIHKL